MKRRAVTLSLASAGLLLATSASADTSFNVSGFGTLGVTHNDNHDADYVAHRFQLNGPGRSSPTMFGVDTKAGVQASASIGNDLSATVQVVSDHRSDNSYAPRFEWANFKFQVTKDAYVRVGRVVAPAFMVSDSRNVGYAQTMVRVPVEVYGQNPITHLDGLEVGYRMAVGSGALSVQATAGIIKEQVQPTVLAKGHSQLLNILYEQGASTFRVGYSRFKFTFEGSDIDNSMLPFSYGSYVNYTGPALTTKDLKTGLFSLGYSYDAGNWLAQAEFITPRGGGVTIADSNAGYVMAGYRFGKFTPYAVYAESVTKETRSSQPRAVNHSTIPQLDLVAYGINAVNDKFNSLQNQKTISLGARYDVAKNIALKMQLDHIKKPGSLTTPNVGWFAVPIPVYPNTLPDAATKDISANLLTLTLDFVF